MAMVLRVGQRSPAVGVAPTRLASSELRKSRNERRQSHGLASCSSTLQPGGWFDGLTRSAAGLSFHSSVARSLRAGGPSTGRVQPTRMMFERFTEKAIKVVMLAQEEARRLGHNFVGTEQARNYFARICTPCSDLGGLAASQRRAARA